MFRICAAGGEGVMLRKPGSCYWPYCRSTKLLKLTPRALELARPPAPRAGAREAPPGALGLDMGRPEKTGLARVGLFPIRPGKAPEFGA